MRKIITKGPKGTKDVLPTESYKWQYVEGIIREICKESLYREVRTPVFEHTELFLRGVGDTTDIVQKEMYTFEDKGKRSITLKPEGTAGAVRSFVESGLAAGSQPTKMYYLSTPVFRYENPQAGRLREHHQFGVEVFGAPDPSVDAEIINIALRVFAALKVPDLSLNINSIGCKNCRPAYNKKLVEYFEEKKDGLCDTCKERLYKNPLRILDCKEEKCREIAKDAPLIVDNLCDECAKHFESLKKYLKLLGIKYSVNPYIVRGLDYYTKTVFEIISNNIGAQGTVCGGGRYDGLVKEIGGPQMAGIGFGMGIERLLLVMENLGIEIPQPNLCDIYFATMGESAKFKAFEIALKLRSKGISAEIDHVGRSLKAQFKYADKIGANYVCTIGENEISENAASIRNMNDGTETKTSLDDICKFFEQEKE